MKVLLLGWWWWACVPVILLCQYQYVQSPWIVDELPLLEEGTYIVCWYCWWFEGRQAKIIWLSSSWWCSEFSLVRHAFKCFRILLMVFLFMTFARNYFISGPVLKICIRKTVVFTFCFFITKNDDLHCQYNPYLYTWLKVRFSSFNNKNWHVIALCDHTFCYSY